MMKSTESLIGTTWLADDALFACHDNVTDVDWDAISDKVFAGEYNENQIALIGVFAYLSSYEPLESIGIDAIGALPEFERLAVLDALRIHWSGVQLQENL